MPSPTQTQLLDELERLASEERNPASMHLDTLSTQSLLETINSEDKKVANAVGECIGQVTHAVDVIAEKLRSNGRLIYIGAGSSGRLGILDAVECRPTFSVPDTLVVGIIAGGEKAIQHAVEGAEDNREMAVVDLSAINLSERDSVVGLSASGRTPYVVSALEYANQCRAATVSITCNPLSPMEEVANIGICAKVGPECLTGSTRMKSGTAQKLILNMISTSVMIKLGKVYENLMVDVNATNEKLKARAVRIVMQATQCDKEVANLALAEAGNEAKLAILMVLTGVKVDKAKTMLADNAGYLRKAMQL